MLSSSQLKEIVRTIRKCKSLSEEKTFVARECLDVRNAFNGTDQQAKCVAMTKLLYFHILGYSGTIGQIECLKLIASNRFVDKRIGYLGCMMLLDENDDIHVMITNCLKNDLNNPSNYIKSLALCTLASICSVEIGKMVATWIEPLMLSNAPYVRRKAALCACRIISKVPIMCESFISYVPSLLDDNNHDIKMAGCTLAITIIESDPEQLNIIKAFNIIGNLIQTITAISNNNIKREFTVHKVPNPFLQVKILRLFSLLAKGDDNNTNQLVSIIAQILTNTTRRNCAADSILYEAVLTTFAIEPRPDLLNMAMTVLRRFLDSSNPNSRYVSLALLLKISSQHDLNQICNREDIYSLINDKDYGIKKRAVELLFATIKQENVQSTIEKLTVYLSTVEPQLKRYITSNLLNCLEKYQFDDLWYINIFIDLLETASTYIRDSSISYFLSVITNCKNNHTAVERLLRSIQTNSYRTIVNNIAGWVVGEFGHTLLQPPHQTDITPHEMISTLTYILKNPSTALETKYVMIYSLMKLSSKLSLDKEITETIQQFMNDTDTEIQQRACEWFTFTSKYPTIRSEAFDSMPPLSAPEVMNEPQPLLQETVQTKTNEPQDLLLQFEDIFGGNETKKSTNSLSPPKHKYNLSVFNKNNIKIDLLFDDPSKDGTLIIEINATNSGGINITNVEFQVAVPKSMSTSLSPPSSTNLLANSSNNIQQQLHLYNPQKLSPSLMMKISYYINDSIQSEIVKITEFPQLIYPL